MPVSLFAENRARLVARLRGDPACPQVDDPFKSVPKLSNETAIVQGSLVLLQGGGDQGVCEGDSSDVGPIFRQESYFHWWDTKHLC